MILSILSINIHSLQKWISVPALLLVCLVSYAYAAQEEVIPIRLVSVITVDDHGAPVSFPHELAYDPVNKETFLVSSTGRITVYDHKFFPIGSFGKGRGLLSPQGITVDRKGNIYVCQGDIVQDALVSPRLTIYNPAFFKSREIIFSEIPELKNFHAMRVAVNSQGLIYLVGSREMGTHADNSGAAVLSAEGKFLHWIVPRDLVFRPEKFLSDGAADSADTVEAAEKKEETVEEAAVEIPDAFKPKVSGRDVEDDEDQEKMYPVYLADVVIDSTDRIYLLSREVSHAYVYNANEEFLFKFGEKGGADRKLSNPTALAVDYPRRTIYVLDYMRHTVLAYDYDTGKFIFEFGGRGFNPLWFNFPNHIEVDEDGLVIVADLFNRRVQVIDTNMRARRPLFAQVTPDMGAGGELPEQSVTIDQPEKEKEPKVVVSESLEGEVSATLITEPGGTAVDAALLVAEPVTVVKAPAVPMVEPVAVVEASTAPMAKQVAEEVPAARMAKVSSSSQVSVPDVPGRQTETGAPAEPPLPSSPKLAVRPKPVPPKQIRPSKAKKVAPSAKSVVAESLPVDQGLIPEPVVAESLPVVREVIPEPLVQEVLERGTHQGGTSKKAPVQRILWLTASLGVYGPIAALGLLGGWFFSLHK